eukprot:GHVS01012162.1.p1 GENE.GHVS01012162.1~~GHVS01012162.1.p1  ORF type:complete len:399 (-),score=81.31 GHVS01012162.1:97-1293(-)
MSAVSGQHHRINKQLGGGGLSLLRSLRKSDKQTNTEVWLRNRETFERLNIRKQRERRAASYWAKWNYIKYCTEVIKYSHRHHLVSAQPFRRNDEMRLIGDPWLCPKSSDQLSDELDEITEQLKVAQQKILSLDTIDGITGGIRRRTTTCGQLGEGSSSSTTTGGEGTSADASSAGSIIVYSQMDKQWLGLIDDAVVDKNDDKITKTKNKQNKDNSLLSTTTSGDCENDDEDDFGDFDGLEELDESPVRTPKHQTTKTTTSSQQQQVGDNDSAVVDKVNDIYDSFSRLMSECDHDNKTTTANDEQDEEGDVVVSRKISAGEIFSQLLKRKGRLENNFTEFLTIYENKSGWRKDELEVLYIRLRHYVRLRIKYFVVFEKLNRLKEKEKENFIAEFISADC